MCLSLWVAACVHEPPVEGWKVTKDARTGVPRVPMNEGSVLGEVLKDYLKGRGGIVVREESIPVTKKKSLSFPQDLKTMKQVLPGVTQSVLDAFVKANKQIYIYKSLGEAAVGLGADLVPGGKIEAVLRGEDGFDDFFKKYPKAHSLVTAARPGVDERRKTALVYFTVASGELTGNGVLVLAKRDGDGWKAAQKAVLWSAGD